MASARLLSSAARLARPSTLVSPTLRQARTYAAPAGGGVTSQGGNLGLYLGVAGMGGLGLYTYLHYDSAKAELAHLKKDLEHAPSKGARVLENANNVAAAQKAAGNGPESSGSGALAKDKWTPFTLEEVKPYNHNTKIYTFSFGPEGKNKVSGGEVASCLLVKTPEGEDEVKDDKGKPVIRPYTPISTSTQEGSLDLMIKEYPNGKLTSYMATLQPGQQLLFKGPNTKFKYEPNTFDKGLAIAGGSGITPMYQLIHHSLAIPDDKTKWTLVFSNVTEKDILLREEWDDLAKQHPDRLSVNYVLDKGPWGWKGETGFITPKVITKLFPRSSEEKVKVFVCGPPPQVKSIAGPKDGPRQGELLGALKELGYAQDEVYKF